MEKRKWYIPDNIFCDVLQGKVILLNPTIGVAEYKVHINKNGDYWVNGVSLSRSLDYGRVSYRAYLNEKQKAEYNDVNDIT